MKKATKRKIKRFIKRNAFAFFFGVFFISAFLMSTGYALLKTDLNLTGKGQIIVGNVEVDPEDAGGYCMSSITTEVTTAPWSRSALKKGIYDVTITNNSDESYHSWKLRMDATDDTSIITSYATTERVGDYIYFTSYSWNAEIAPGSSYTFEIELESSADMQELLDSIIITTCGRVTGEQEIITDGNASLVLGQDEVQLDVLIEGTELGTWGGVANIYTITFTNNTEYTVTDYRAVIYYGGVTLNNVYPVNKTDDPENSLVTITNTSPGNATLEPGMSTSVTFVVNTTDPTYIPQIVAAGLKKQLKEQKFYSFFSWHKIFQEVL